MKDIHLEIYKMQYCRHVVFIYRWFLEQISVDKNPTGKVFISLCLTSAIGTAVSSVCQTSFSLRPRTASRSRSSIQLSSFWNSLSTPNFRMSCIWRTGACVLKNLTLKHILTLKADLSLLITMANHCVFMFKFGFELRNFYEGPTVETRGCLNLESQ